MPAPFRRTVRECSDFGSYAAIRTLADARTLHKLADLGAKYVRRNQRHTCDWYVYMTKAWAADVGDELAATEQIIWLDTDVLVMSEPCAYTKAR